MKRKPQIKMAKERERFYQDDEMVPTASASTSSDDPSFEKPKVSTGVVILEDELGLYGLPNGTWDVKLPKKMVPPDMPEPTLGINFARKGSPKQEWFAMVALHSDSLLLALTFYFGSYFGLDQDSRNELFSMINNLARIHEMVTGAAKKQTNKRTSDNRSKINKSASRTPSSSSECPVSRSKRPRKA